jgi:nucleotide-binding universal stress UspA family protein
MFSKILVPLDSSDLAEYALRPAIALAQKAEGSVLLLHVLTPKTVVIPELPEVMAQSMYSYDVSFSQEEAAGRDYLGGIQQNIAQGYDSISWSARVENGDPASMIVDVAQEEGVGLIVMSTHGYSGVTRWMLGSVTERVLRHASCPVLVVRSQEAIRHVLVTLDGSPLAESSLPLGFAVALGLGAVITLLRVDTESDYLDEREIVALEANEPGLGNRYRQRFADTAAHYLQGLAVGGLAMGLQVHTAVRSGKTAQTILQFVEQNDVDLIVMSTHGRSGLARWRYGSVTEKVLHGASCAILINRPKELDE